MLSFLDILKDDNEDVTKVETTLKSKWDKTITVIKEAFKDKYTTKDYAIHLITVEYPKKTPKTIDATFLKENTDYIVNKIKSLDEGSIKIIINNDSGSNQSNCEPVQTTSTIPMVVNNGEDMNIETESVDPKKRGRGRPPKDTKDVKKEDNQIEETTIDETKGPKFKTQKDKDNYYRDAKKTYISQLKKGSISQERYDSIMDKLEKEEEENLVVETEISDKIINTNEDDPTDENGEVLEERKKAKKDKEEETKKNKKDDDDKDDKKGKSVVVKVYKEELENTKETNMKSDNTISWKDIESVTIESIEESKLPSVKKGDTIIVAEKKYKVESVIPNTKNPNFTVVKVASQSQQSFVLAEIDSVENLIESETQEIVTENETESDVELAPGETNSDKMPSEETPSEENNEEKGETEEKPEEIIDEPKKKDLENIEPGDKIVVGEDKFLVLDVNFEDKDDKKITVEDEDGIESTLNCNDIEITEIEKAPEENEEESEEGSEEENKETKTDEEKENMPTESTYYDQEGLSIRDTIRSARKLIETINKSETPKVPDSSKIKVGSTLTKVISKPDIAEPKMTNGVPPKTSPALKFTGENSDDSMPKTTGVGVKEMQKKDKTANGFTQAVQKFLVAPDQGMPVMTNGKPPKEIKAMSHSAPQADSKMPSVASATLPKGGSPVTTLNHPMADSGMPKMPKTNLEGYIAQANRFLTED